MYLFKVYLLDTLRPSDTLPTVSGTPELYQLIQFDFQLISVKKVQLYQITSLRRELIQLHFLFLFFRQTCNQNCKDDQTHAGNDVGHHTGGKTGAFGHNADDPGIRIAPLAATGSMMPMLVTLVIRPALATAVGFMPAIAKAKANSSAMAAP